MIESLKWTILEWVLVYCSIPLYFSLAIIINNKWIKKEYKPLYQRRGTMLFTWGIMGGGAYHSFRGNFRYNCK